MALWPASHSSELISISHNHLTLKFLYCCVKLLIHYIEIAHSSAYLCMFDVTFIIIIYVFSFCKI